MTDILTRLQRWYLEQCNGDWEHTYGITISTVDNPGWLLEVELTDTVLLDKPFAPMHIQRENPDDWVICSVTEQQLFRGAGGPRNLEEIIVIFLTWADD